MPRETTVGEFVAESLEDEAIKLPPSKKAYANILRNAAKVYREMGSKKKILVSENAESDGKFIKPDPASR